MRSLSLVLIVGLFIWILSTNSTFAADENDVQAGKPWETLGFSAGIFFSDINTSFRLGSGVAVEVDAERSLDLDRRNRVARVDGFWRFSKNKKHRLDLSWFAFHRSASKTITEELIIEGPDDEEIVIDPGTEVDAFFDIDIYQLSYSYSFLQDDRIDFAFRIGLYVMPIDFGIDVKGVVEEAESQDFIAPMPTIGSRLDIALTPKWFLRMSTQYFYLEYKQYTGSIMASHHALEYKPWKHVGIGAAVDTFRIWVEAEGEDYPEVDLRGEVQFAYTGLQLYLRLYY